MRIQPYLKEKRGGKSNAKYYTITGPKGSLDIGVSFTDRKVKRKSGVIEKREYQVYEINTSKGWTRDCPDTQGILLSTIGETFEGKGMREKWLASVYNGTVFPKANSVKVEIQQEGTKETPKLMPRQSVFTGTPSVQEGTYTVTIHGPTDLITVTKRRGEQGLLRDHLMKGRESVSCAICGRNFIPEHLITAHIKKRSHASEAERRDTSIVVPMCVMGCDALFEGGWVGVKEGRVVRLKTVNSTPVTEEILSGLIANAVSYWNPQTKPYFEWHLQFHNIFNQQDS